jgi:hypothetical protein
MSDRDELDELRGLLWIELQDIAAKQEDIPDDVYWLNLAAAAANAVRKAGWRRSAVTPEQLLAVVQILDDVPAVRFPETWMRKARDIARAFRLEVPSE